VEKQNQAHGTQHRYQNQKRDIFVHGGTTLLGVSAQSALQHLRLRLQLEGEAHSPCGNPAAKIRAQIFAAQRVHFQS
jgi:hypothetical protein